jgi:hypothetical protein
MRITITTGTSTRQCSEVVHRALDFSWSRVEDLSGKRMTECVSGHPLGEPCAHCGLRDLMIGIMQEDMLVSMYLKE